MFSGYQHWEECDDELYCEEDDDVSSLSKPDSELEFRLYSQLHYCDESQEVQGDAGHDGPEEMPPQPGQGSTPAPAAPVEVIVIDSGPDDITISDETEDDDSACFVKVWGSRVQGRNNRTGPPPPSTSLKKASSTKASSTKASSTKASSTKASSTKASSTKASSTKASSTKASSTKASSTKASSTKARTTKARTTKASSMKASSTKTRILMEEVVVLDSEESLNSEPAFVEYPDSDSDGLESWMILGQGKEDGDQDIQLNLSVECGDRSTVFGGNVNDGEDQQNWTISDRDKEAHILNKGATSRRPSNRYYNKKTITCHNCNKVGHLSKNCPNPKKLQCCSLCGHQGHWLKSCPNRPCSNCFLPGHSYDSCLERPYWHKHCHRCSMTGHFINDCPENWRQYHLTTAVGPPIKGVHPTVCRSPAYCYNCSKKGHYGHECSDRRMFNGTYPTLPLICFYDTLKAIRYAQKCAQKRAQELQEAGLLGSTEAPPTTQPPRKKKKTNPQNAFSPYTPAARAPKKRTAHAPKKRIAHTPKHHPHTPAGPNPPAHCQKGVHTPAQEATPQLQGKKKNRRKKKKNQMVLDNDDFPRGTDGTATPAKRGPRSPRMPFSAGKSSDRSNNKKKNRAQKRAKMVAAMCDTGVPDENLFIIKQRKRSR
ncbi:zinc finger CCHC domain-containing protein 7 [Brachyhypopomus gauderio]|uniref:zinc finger CCHC domain-containing protein 7 n=1 Tax=Brachyhypopomus gauderio TaxID=698409 RepID=UPI004041EE4F